jgi:succinate dehydrogenase flavin-adding protein (antitoxin of CptAB toxin-antitoxin module)
MSGLEIIKDFFNLNFIKETNIKIGISNKEKYSEYEAKIDDFIRLIEVKDNDIFKTYFWKTEIETYIIIHLRLNKKIAQKELNKMIKEIRDKKFEIDMPGFYEETDIECFIVEVFIQGNYDNDEIVIRMRFLEILDKDMLIEYFKILKETLEKYYKVGV